MNMFFALFASLFSPFMRFSFPQVFYSFPWLFNYLEKYFVIPPFAVQAMPTINLSYSKLLHEVYEQLQLEVPQSAVSSNSDGQFVSSMDLQIPRNETVVETVRCESAPFPTYAAAEQDAARRALRRLKDECNLQVKDVNYEDSVIYKNLYDH